MAEQPSRPGAERVHRPGGAVSCNGVRLCGGQDADEPRAATVDESCARHAGHVAAQGTQAGIHQAVWRQGAADAQQELRSPAPLQRQGRGASADRSSIHRGGFRGFGRGAREPSELCPPTGRHTLRRRSLGFGGALQQPPSGHMVPHGQRQHPGERHRVARDAASGSREDHRARPTAKAVCRPHEGPGCTRHEHGDPLRLGRRSG